MAIIFGVCLAVVIGGSYIQSNHNQREIARLERKLDTYRKTLHDLQMQNFKK